MTPRGELSGHVVLVSGPPGAGKTTTASTLAAQTPNGVHIESDMFYRWIRSDFMAPHLPEAQAQNIAVMDVMVDAAAAYADAGYAVYIDGVIGPWFVERVSRRLAARGQVTHYLLLRPSREVALARVRDREQTDDVGGAAVMYDLFASLGEFESHVVATDGDPATVVAACAARLGDGSARLDVDAWVDTRWRVSVKGVVGWDGKFVVLRNGRGEWELPGGRLDDTDSSPQDTVRREMTEELGLDVDVGRLVDSWVYEVAGHRVLILTYVCTADRPDSLWFSEEHSDVALMSLSDLETESIPAGYLATLRTFERLRSGAAGAHIRAQTSPERAL